jgi:hypothetical protein
MAFYIKLCEFELVKRSSQQLQDTPTVGIFTTT